ncbi:hypothetical protein BH160DRAFT_5379, partial [Burkholderia sp. H160]
RTASLGRHLTSYRGRSICQHSDIGICQQTAGLTGFGIFRQTVRCPIPGYAVLDPSVSRWRNFARFIERAGRNIHHVGRFGVCVSQWRPAFTAKRPKNPRAGFKRLWYALYPTESVLAYTEPGNRWRCRYLPACGAVAKRRVERSRMNLIPDGTAVASTCQHQIPRPIVPEQIVGNPWQLVERRRLSRPCLTEMDSRRPSDGLHFEISATGRPPERLARLPGASRTRCLAPPEHRPYPPRPARRRPDHGRAGMQRG